MRKFKDKSPIPIKHRKIYAFAILESFALAGIHYIEYGNLSIENIIGIALATFLIYGIWFGGIYKIARYFAERNAKNSDNDFNPTRFK